MKNIGPQIIHLQFFLFFCLFYFLEAYRYSLSYMIPLHTEVLMGLCYSMEFCCVWPLSFSYAALRKTASNPRIKQKKSIQPCLWSRNNTEQPESQAVLKEIGRLGGTEKYSSFSTTTSEVHTRVLKPFKTQRKGEI